jgi:HD-GYP domain-containing protein (c-di-GMP phosphodiesterase class II)
MNKKIDYEYEKKFLDDFMEGLKLFDFNIYQKMNRTGILASKIGQVFNIEDKEYYFAGFYANVGMLSINNLINNPNFINEERQKEQIKRHPILSSEFLEKKGLLKSAKLVYHHHELPNGGGYYKLTNSPKEAYYINIADTFDGVITPKLYRPALTLKEAIEATLRPYENFFKKNELNKIEDVLTSFYKEIFHL